MKKIFFALILLINISLSIIVYPCVMKWGSGQPFSFLDHCKALPFYTGATLLAPVWIPIVITITIRDHFEIIKKEKQAQIKKKQMSIKAKKTALFDAVYSNNLVELKKLAKKSTMKVFDDAGNTPLHKAAQMGNEKLFCFIYSIGPELMKIENNAGKTPIEIAIEHGHFIIIQKLYNSIPDNRSFLAKLTDLICGDMFSKIKTNYLNRNRIN